MESFGSEKNKRIEHQDVASEIRVGQVKALFCATVSEHGLHYLYLQLIQFTSMNSTIIKAVFKNGDFWALS